MRGETRPSGAGSPRISVALVVGGRWHDMEFARVELLKKLLVHDRIQTHVLADYEAGDIIESCDFLISYTCDVTPSSRAVERLRRWLEAGGRWFALHATNSVIRFLEDGRVGTPDAAPEFFELLGSQFAAHPPLGTFRVDVADAQHPLVAGIEPFDTHDEQYLLRRHAELHVLLDTTFAGTTPRFEDDDWPEQRHPVLYLRGHGRGCCLYLTLGHCRGPYDMAPITPERRPPTRCSWDLPIYHELLERGIAWAMEPSLERITKNGFEA